jgi:formiminoglutamase
MENRAQFRIKNLFTDDFSHSAYDIFLKSECDLGVRLNLGRHGARFAPAAILYELKKMIHPLTWQDRSMKEVSVADSGNDFNQAQINQITNIVDALSTPIRGNIIQLGGGHDHIYCLAMALYQKYQKKIKIINLDAHADTRTDSCFHSGTPFRQLDQKIPMDILQIGLNAYANSPSTLSPLKNRELKIFNRYADQHFIQKIQSAIVTFLTNDNSEEFITLLSLDCDVINASEMEAVSAVNPSGISYELVECILNWVKDLGVMPRTLGIYEYNPVYDTLSNKGAKQLAHLIYKWLE